MLDLNYDPPMVNGPGKSTRAKTENNCLSPLQYKLSSPHVKPFHCTMRYKHLSSLCNLSLWISAADFSLGLTSSHCTKCKNGSANVRTLGLGCSLAALCLVLMRSQKVLDRKSLLFVASQQLMIQDRLRSQKVQRSGLLKVGLLISFEATNYKSQQSDTS